jgi:hypothetical protein
MNISKNEGILLFAGVAVVGILWYLAYDKVENKVAPKQEVMVSGGFSAALDKCTVDEFFTPGHLGSENIQLQFTPHRYPNVTGGNISTLIHLGMSQLRLPAPQDDKWITRPPAEIQW